MSERVYGYLYDRERSVKDDAALIRATIKTMSSAGVLPADWRYSVRYRTASQMRAIDVTALSPRPLWWMESGIVRAAADRDRVVHVPIEGAMQSLRIPAGMQHEVRWCDIAMPEAAAVSAALQELLNACNHDGSDSQTDYFDVKFYGHPVLDTVGDVPRCLHVRPSYLPARLARR